MEVLSRQPFLKQKPMIIGHHPEKMRLLTGLDVEMVMLREDGVEDKEHVADDVDCATI